MQNNNTNPENATGPLAIVTEAAQLNETTYALLIRASKEAKDHGHTYEQIGKASGVSTTQAWRRVNGKVQA